MSTTAHWLQGIVVPVITPLDDDEELDTRAFRAHLACLLQAGVQGIFVLGTTGEFALLRERVKKDVVNTAVDHVAGAVPVLVGASACGTRQAVEMAGMARESGADGLVALPPYYFSANRWEDLICHFKAIVDRAGLPLFVYNQPQYAKQSLALEVVEQLSQTAGMVGVKDSSNDFTYFCRLLQRLHGRSFAIFQGNETMLAASLLAGAQGGVASWANVAPGLFVALYRACQAADLPAVRRLQAQIVSLHQLNTIVSVPVQAIKAACKRKGFGNGHMAAPFGAAAPSQEEQIAARLKDLGLL